MTIQQQILQELKNTDFPNLQFFYSPEVLAVAEQVLESLLAEEKKDFQKKLQTPDEKISFETFEDFSYLDYFFSLLEHYQGVNNDETIRTIIESFEPKYIDFSNEVAYSKRYYEMLKICEKQLTSTQNLSLNSLSSKEREATEQLRIIKKSVESFEIRGIALDDEKQKTLKKINKDLSELGQKFWNNVLDSQKEFEYILTDESIISEMPEDDKAVARKRFDEKNWIKKATSEEEFKKCFEFFQVMWNEEFAMKIGDEQFESFRNSDIFYIGEKKILWWLQLLTIDEKIFQYEPELLWIANTWEKILWRVWVLSESRWIWLWKKLIWFAQNFCKSEWENRLFLPSEIKNVWYYEKFWFWTISEPKSYEGVEWIMMMCSINKENYLIDTFLFDASQGSYMAIMKYCSDSSVRKHFFEARQKFATEEERNNKTIILETLKLRDQKAKLLGFWNYAELSLHFKMAESPEQVIDLFSSIAEKARPKAQAELDEIQSYFKLTELNVWDLWYYARKLREEKYSLDDKKLKKYFEFKRVLAWMFEITNKLYGIEMKQVVTPFSSGRERIQEWGACDIQIYEVSQNGKFLSYFFTDFFYRPLKRQGAWANILRENFQGNKKIVLNVCNFQKGVSETLLTLSDVETMFHEFGHAIHEMLSQSEHSELSGFHVEHDFVELPSQLLENWCRHEDGLKIFAEHYKTGEAIPQKMLDTLKELDTFWNGQFVLKQNEYAMMDMMLHIGNIPSSEVELDSIVQKNYSDNSLFKLWTVYNPHTSFSHIFDWGYAALYYSYMWAEIIEKEVWKVFKDSWDIFSSEISQKFHDCILSQGTTKKASELFRDFFGRDVEIDAFLKEKGLC